MYQILAYYKFVPIENPEREAENHKSFFHNRGMTGRIYFSLEGVNGTISGPEEQCSLYMEWLAKDRRFSDIDFKIHAHHENAFPRMTVKVRKQLVALDRTVDVNQGGEYVTPKEWKEMLESKEYLLLDVRNDYEWDVGHFEGSERPPCASFRDATRWAKELREKHDPKKTKVMMCCTGGIRCELYSALMKEEGFDEVYQLKGGILKYGQKEGGKHWKGKLFVFDDRLAVDIAKEKSVVGKCHGCQSSAERHYNCADMDCNALFLSCADCLEKRGGCCNETCQGEARVRPLDHQLSPKPFRRWYTYFAHK